MKLYSCFSRKDGSIGVFYYLLGLLLMALMGASAKKLTENYSVVQIVFFNDIVALVCIFMFFDRDQRNAILSPKWLLLIIRGIISTGTVFFYFFGLQYLTWAEVAAIFAVAPLIMTLLSGWLLQEKIDLPRWIAIIVGFLGAIIIIRPENISYNHVVLLPLGAALTYAVALVYAKSLIKTETNSTILIYTYSVACIFSGIALPFFWLDVTLPDLAVFLSMGIFLSFGNYYCIKGCRYAPIHVVAPFDYTALIWAGILGYVFWKEVPTVWIWLGASCIVTSGFYVVRKHDQQT